VQYFIQKLIDGDLASNNGGWQWSASTGVDPCPYFRIFNPHSQSLKVTSYLFSRLMPVLTWMILFTDRSYRELHKTVGKVARHMWYVMLRTDSYQVPELNKVRGPGMFLTNESKPVVDPITRYTPADDFYGG